MKDAKEFISDLESAFLSCGLAVQELEGYLNPFYIEDPQLFLKPLPEMGASEKMAIARDLIAVFRKCGSPGVTP